MINIIKAADAELEAAMRIRMEVLQVVNGLSEDVIFDSELINSTKEYFKSAEQTTLLALDEEVIGCATICYIGILPTFDHPGGKRAHIMNVYTRNAYHRQGIAFRMMEMLIDEARQRGITEISLDATKAGRPLYDKCGFIETKEGMVLTM